ncbi:MAG: hypothetical protein ACPHCN_18795, partial [Mycobacterium sp.]
MDELQRLRDAIWNDGDPLRDEDGRYCVYCECDVEGGSGKHHVDRHDDACPWIHEFERREMLAIGCDDTVKNTETG